ncbi:DUF4185 domain-containing protein [Aeromicrobium chenweiae]|uniref:DUF4185 domain-containing protein n=1 Tax=Aeromicrobium chenweiae TaxID=2079793 RepID=A0A2S0WRC9_9ACTN|nr:DUF4185 domain-containing protein [Aeromicrobium chenweiae]AWB93871.1 hypothetical protein C3E78_17550 [Aeromicrobium chenweiae]TGN30916.1 DUF4185 domain-containing protein [Aeromicrobium chenweiae]
MRIRWLPWRLRVVAVTVPAAAAMFTAVALAPAPQDAEPMAVAPAAETSCLPIEPLTSVKALNRLATKVRGGSEFQGADVGADVTLQDGRRLWVFGDTLRAKDFRGQRFVRNSMLLFRDGCADVVLPADHGALIPDRKDGVGYWPMSVAKVERPGYDLVGVAAQRVRGATVPDGALAFENLGPAIAVFIVPAGKTPQLIRVRDIGRDLAGTSRPTWGAAAAVHDGWVYLYGTANRGASFGYSLQVARIRPDDILEPSRLRYWDGKRWQRTASRAAVLIPAQGGVSQTLSVFEQDGRWYAVSKRDEFLGTDLVVWSAPRPTGPFVAGPTVAQIPSEEKSGTLRYMPLAHPDLLPRKGTVVVSYSQNNADVARVDKNPFLYRPRFLRITLPTPTPNR